MTDKLKGIKIAFLATDGVEQSELERPWQALKDEGAETELISLEIKDIQGMQHDEKGNKFPVDRPIEDADASEYDCLVLPGGVANPDKLRTNEKSVDFVRSFFDQKKPVAAICHGPWLLVEADVLKGRTVTSWPSLKTDIRNAGGEWVDEEVCIDNNLVTSRKPDDLDAFCQKAIETFSQANKEEQAAA